MASYLVTGSTRGIGFELVRQLSEKPLSEVSTIIATSRSVNAALQDLADRHPNRVVLVHLDVAIPETIQRAAHTIEDILGDKGLDVLINNAGIVGWGRLKDMLVLTHGPHQSLMETNVLQDGPGRHVPCQCDGPSYHNPDLLAAIAEGLHEEDHQHVRPS